MGAEFSTEHLTTYQRNYIPKNFLYISENSLYVVDVATIVDAETGLVRNLRIPLPPFNTTYIPTRCRSRIREAYFTVTSLLVIRAISTLHYTHST